MGELYVMNEHTPIRTAGGHESRRRRRPITHHRIFPPAPEATVRLAALEELPELIQLTQELHAENGQHDLSYLKIRDAIAKGLMLDNAVMAVIGEKGDIRAMLLLHINTVYYSDEKQIVELWNFVRCDSRRSNYGKQLLDFAMQYADSLGMHLTIGIMSDESLEAKTRLYERVLGVRSGSVFVYKPKVLSDGR